MWRGGGGGWAGLAEALEEPFRPSPPPPPQPSGKGNASGSQATRPPGGGGGGGSGDATFRPTQSRAIGDQGMALWAEHPPSPPGGGGVRGQKEVCVPKIGLFV